MKKLLLILLCVPLIGMGQWSDYYKIDAKIKKDVNVSGNITHNHNITTIDYGKLAYNANAEKERIRLEKIKYNDEKERLIENPEIIDDPKLAYKYGTKKYGQTKKSIAKFYGFKKLEYQYTLLNKHLFNRIDGESGIVMSNVDKNIITEISLGIPYNYSGMISYKDNSTQDVACHFEREFFGINFCAEYPECGSRFILKRGVENFIKANYHLSTESEIDMLNGAYLHKKDISRIRIYGKPGYLLTLIYEDDYEYIIHDTYIVSGGVIFSGNVFYKEIRMMYPSRS